MGKPDGPATIPLDKPSCVDNTSGKIVAAVATGGCPDTSTLTTKNSFSFSCTIISDCKSMLSDIETKQKDMADTTTKQQAAKDAVEAKKNVTSAQEDAQNKLLDLADKINKLDSDKATSDIETKKAQDAANSTTATAQQKVQAAIDADNAQKDVAMSGVQVAQAGLNSAIAMNSMDRFQSDCLAKSQANSKVTGDISNAGATLAKQNADYKRCIAKDQAAAMQLIAEAQKQVSAATAAYNSLIADIANQTKALGQLKADAARQAVTDQQAVAAAQKAYSTNRTQALSQYVAAQKAGAQKVADAQQAYQTAQQIANDPTMQNSNQSILNSKLQDFHSECCTGNDGDTASGPCARVAKLAKSNNNSGNSWVSQALQMALGPKAAGPLQILNSTSGGSTGTDGN